MLLKELRTRHCLIRKIIPTIKYIENCTELNLLLVMVTETDLQQAKLRGVLVFVPLGPRIREEEHHYRTCERINIEGSNINMRSTLNTNSWAFIVFLLHVQLCVSA